MRLILWRSVRVLKTPSVTAFTFERLLTSNAAVPSLALTVEGHLMITVCGELMARTETMLLCSESLDVCRIHCSMPWVNLTRRLPDMVSFTGDGHVVLGRAQERFYPLALERDLCFFVENRVWAFESQLMWDMGAVPGSRELGEIALLRLAGDGLIALRVPGELVAIKIEPTCPQRVRDDRLVGWIGSVVPWMELGTPFLHCEGEGAVLVTLPHHLGDGERKAS